MFETDILNKKVEEVRAADSKKGSEFAALLNAVSTTPAAKSAETKERLGYIMGHDGLK